MWQNGKGYYLTKWDQVQKCREQAKQLQWINMNGWSSKVGDIFKQRGK